MMYGIDTTLPAEKNKGEKRFDSPLPEINQGTKQITAKKKIDPSQKTKRKNKRSYRFDVDNPFVLFPLIIVLIP